MYEVWTNKDEPSTRLVVPAGSGLPVELGSRDWLCLGPAEIGPDTAHEVATRGYAFVQSDAPPPDPQRLKNDDAAGA